MTKPSRPTTTTSRHPPLPETQLAQRAVRELEAAGFVVEQEVALAPAIAGGRYRADILGLTADDEGILAPEVLVEVKQTASGSGDELLAQLSRYAYLSRATRAYIYNGEWLEADAAFSRLLPAECPRPRRSASGARYPESWVRKKLEAAWHSLVAGRAGERSPTAHDVDAWLAQFTRLPDDKLVFARVLSSLKGVYYVPAELSDALARLLNAKDGSSVFDPFCRVGGCLWAVAEDARLRGVSVRLAGNERSPQWGEIAQHLAKALDPAPTITVGSSAPAGPFDAVVSVLPFGMREPIPVLLSTGDRTSDPALAALDSMEAWLKPGGRAVLVVAPNLLCGSGVAEHVRATLARSLHVAAIVELPSAVFASAAIPTSIVVLQKRRPGETLVARLGDDRREQLAEGGDFMKAYRAHMGEIAP